jgi:hypothetical protein
VGWVSQLFRVRSLQLVMTSISAMARAATTARVFMAQSVQVGSGRAVGRSVRSQYHIRHIGLLQGRRKSCMRCQTVSSLGFCMLL